jgi:FSR family fosmidomycin resistance protein-like MFS transporter
VAVGVHSLVDFFSFVVVSLLPLLAVRLEMTPAEKALLLGMGSVTSGLIQPLVAWLSDRLDTRWFGTIGVVVAVVAISLIGHARSFEQLLLLHALGAAGVGAFHPPAAATVGALAGRKRSLGVAVFFLAGMAGGMAGNIGAPALVSAMAERAGQPDYDAALRGLSWLIAPGLLAAAALAIAIHRVPHRRHGAREAHDGLSEAERRARWNAVGVLYAGNIVRFSVNMALVYLFVAWAEAHVLRVSGAAVLDDALGGRASALNGPLQAAMQVGMGVVGLMLGLLLRPSLEKAAFVLFPLLGAGLICLMPLAEHASPAWAVPVAVLLSVGAGIGFGALVPASLSLAQRLLPHRTSLASALMLGGAWAFAFVGPKAAAFVHGRWGLDAGFYATAVALAVAGMLSLLLPRKLLMETAAH